MGGVVSDDFALVVVRGYDDYNYSIFNYDDDVVRLLCPVVYHDI